MGLLYGENCMVNEDEIGSTTTRNFDPEFCRCPLDLKICLAPPVAGKRGKKAVAGRRVNNLPYVPDFSQNKHHDSLCSSEDFIKTSTKMFKPISAIFMTHLS